MNYIILIKENKNGSRPPIQSWSGEIAPGGFYFCPETMILVFTTAKGFVDITTENGIVTSMTENTAAKKVWEESQIPIPADQRKIAYATLACITWENEQITVDFANTLWVAYSAESNEKSVELSKLIELAKNKIRELYPDKI